MSASHFLRIARYGTEREEREERERERKERGEGERERDSATKKLTFYSRMFSLNWLNQIKRIFFEGFV